MTGTLQITKQKRRGSLSSTFERVMGLEPTISCLGSKRSTTELHPRIVENYIRIYGTVVLFKSRVRRAFGMASVHAAIQGTGMSLSMVNSMTPTPRSLQPVIDSV
jgi:hypothetical protein